MTDEIFISYKRERKELVAWLDEVLRAWGLSSWYDDGLEEGQSFEDQLRQKMNEVKVILVFLCSEADESLWVRKEITVGMEQGKLFPLKFCPAMSLPEDLRKQHSMDIMQWNGDPRHNIAINLVDRLKRRLNRPELEGDFDAINNLQKFWRGTNGPWKRLTAGQTATVREVSPASDVIVIPVGSVLCGAKESDVSDALPEQIVRITKPYGLDRYPVTVAQWIHYLEAIGESDGAVFRDPGHRNHPIVNVSWFEANSYVKWLSRTSGLRYRLPTEAEWEYAARGGKSGLLYGWGNEIDSTLANYDDRGPHGERGGAPTSGIAEVSSFKPNAFGLYGMHGNVWEWVADSFVEAGDYDEYLGKRAIGAPVVLDYKREGRAVVRGGAWNSPPEHLCCANRRFYFKKEARPHVGFRVARDIT